MPLAGLAGAVGADRFRKMFFLHPDSEELLGRVDLGYGAAGAAIFPLYYRAAIGSSVVPGAPPPPPLLFSSASLPSSAHMFLLYRQLRRFPAKRWPHP